MYLHTNSQNSFSHRRQPALVGIGSTITIRDMHTFEREVYILVRPDDVDIELNRISSFSPLGKALGNRREGEVVELHAPGGFLRFEIEAVLAPDERRQAMVEAG